MMEANSPTAKQVQFVYHHTLSWLISFSFVLAGRLTDNSIAEETK
jgi:hypothetical protein